MSRAVARSPARNSDSPGLVQVAREDLAVGAEVGVRGVARGDRLPPRRGERGRDGAGERLVLGRLDVIRAEVVLRQDRVPVGARHPAARAPRRDQAGVIAVPAPTVRGVERAGNGAERPARGRDGRGRVAPEAEREVERAVGAEVDLGGLHEVAVVGRRERRGERVAGVELVQAVARLPGEAVGHLRERPRGVQGAEDGLRVVAVGRVRLRDRIRADEQRVARGGRDVPAVGAAVAVPAAPVAVERRVEADVEAVVACRAAQRLEARAQEHGRTAGVGEVVGDDPVAAALRRRRDPARERAVVEGADRVGHVAGLEIRERRAVGDDVLQRLVLGRVVRRVVDVAQHAVGDGEPDLRRPVARGADAVLARQVEVRERAGTVGRGPGRHGAARNPGRGDRERQQDGKREQACSQR